MNDVGLAGMALVPCWGLPDVGWEVPSDGEVLPEQPAWLEQAPWPERPMADVVEPWRWDERRLLAEVARAQRALAAAQAHWLGLLAEAERRQASVQVESIPTSSWLAAGASHSARTARQDVLVATRLAACPAVAAALGVGRVSREQAEAILQGIDRLPDDLDAAERGAVVDHVLDLAADFGPGALRRLVDRAVQVVAPEVAEDADRRALQRAERVQARDRFLTWRRDEEGSVAFWGRLPALEGELLVNRVSGIARGLRRADAVAGVAGLTRAQAHAEALAIVLAHHATCDGSNIGGGDWARLVVTLDHEQLLTGVGVVDLPGTGHRVTAGQVRRLACHAGILPLVLDGASQPLDVGRSQRWFTAAQRSALALRDGGCSFPGCDRPPGDCDAHHLQPWHAGGPTDLVNGVLLCPHHHHLVEPTPNQPPDLQWQIDFDARGKPRYTAPSRTSGVRTTRQHTRYRT